MHLVCNWLSKSCCTTTKARDAVVHSSGHVLSAGESLMGYTVEYGMEQRHIDTTTKLVIMPSTNHETCPKCQDFNQFLLPPELADGKHYRWYCPFCHIVWWYKVTRSNGTEADQAITH